MITKEQFIAYEKVRQSGVTNMFAIDLVGDLSGLSRKECLEIMKTYSQLDKQWPDVRATNWEANGRKIGIVNLEGFGSDEE
jgi:hypothetical protein